MRQQGGFFYSLEVIIILAIVGAGFFCGEKALASQSILINEALIKPLENRFIELYNSSSSPVDLTGWYLQRKTQNGTNFDTLVSKTYFKDKTIGANSYFLISRTSMANADIVINGLTLAGSDTIRLKKSESEIIDTVFLGLAPDDGKSLERKDDGSWQVSQNIGGTPKAQNTSPQPSPLQSGGQAYQGEGAVCGNGQVESGEQCDDGNLVSGDGCSSTCQTETVAAAPVQNNTASSTDLTPSPLLSKARGYNFADVLINELVSDPAVNEVEWIEMYNKLNKEIDLSGWWLEDGAKTKTNLSGVIGVSGSERFKVIEKPNGNLNNDGDFPSLFLLLMGRKL